MSDDLFAMLSTQVNVNGPQVVRVVEVQGTTPHVEAKPLQRPMYAYVYTYRYIGQYNADGCLCEWLAYVKPVRFACIGCGFGCA